MVNKEKLLLLAAIYMLLPGALPDALADAGQASKTRSKKASTVRSVKQNTDAGKPRSKSG